MTPFKLAERPAEYTDPLSIAKKLGISMQEAHQQAAILRHETIYVNDLYQVHVRDVAWPDGSPMKHLSIKRRDKGAIHDWRHLQQIKNMLVGPECEGIELYPAEARLVDEANQFHLWVFCDPALRVPLGAQERLVAGPEEAAQCGARQRPFDPVEAVVEAAELVSRGHRGTTP